MPQVTSNLRHVLSGLPDNVRLIAVSKFQPTEKLREAYDAGQRRFGESRANELAEKAALLPADIEWHFIGHLQTNKARIVAGCASVIESIDSERLLRIVSNEASKAGRVIKVFLQVHVAAEETKTGFLPTEIEEAARLALTLPGIKIAGIMGMATNTDNIERIRRDFRAIAECSRKLREVIPDATEISMGMSGDWPLAVEEGATLVRIGSAIFGDRPYNTAKS